MLGYNVGSERSAEKLCGLAGIDCMVDIFLALGPEKLEEIVGKLELGTLRNFWLQILQVSEKPKSKCYDNNNCSSHTSYISVLTYLDAPYPLIHFTSRLSH
jgi:hypothetical protein